MKYAFFTLFTLLTVNVVVSQETFNNSTFHIKGSDDETLSVQIAESLLNFNPMVDFGRNKIQKSYKNLVPKSASVFMVMLTSSTSEGNIMSLKKGAMLIALSTQKITSDSEVTYHKGNPTEGIIVSHRFDKNSLMGKRKGSLSFDEALFSPESENHVYEVLFFPQFLSDLQTKTVESYLALKYGISLLGDQDYLDGNGNKIWEFKNNGAYSNRVTGIGRDTITGLHQKQSGNYKKDGLFIASDKLFKANADNVSVLPHASFWLWGDNGKDTNIKKAKQGESVKKMERIWKMQVTQKDSLETPGLQAIIDKKQMHLGIPVEGTDAEPIWMVIDFSGSASFNYADAIFIASSKSSQDNLVFTLPKLQRNSNALFTFVQAPEFFVEHDYTLADCDAQNVALMLNTIGGKAPYSVKLHSDSHDATFIIEQNSNELYNLPSENYVMEASDSENRKFSTAFSVGAFSDSSSVTIAPLWDLNDSGEAAVSAVISNETEIVDYQWLKGNEILAASKTFIAKEAGEYRLVVTNNKGCKKELPFIVGNREASVSNKWIISPNPVKPGETFSVSYLYEIPTSVTICIYDLSGKLLLYKDLGKITDHTFNSSLTISGTYMVISAINGVKQPAKLIVN